MSSAVHESVKACRTRSILDDAKAVEIYRYKVDNVLSTKKEIKRAARALSKHFSVTEKTIRDIWKGRTWRFETEHLDPTRSRALVRMPGRPKMREEPAAESSSSPTSQGASSSCEAGSSGSSSSELMTEFKYSDSMVVEPSSCSGHSNTPQRCSFASALQGGVSKASSARRPVEPIENMVSYEAFRCKPDSALKKMRAAMQEPGRNCSVGLLLNSDGCDIPSSSGGLEDAALVPTVPPVEDIGRLSTTNSMSSSKVASSWATALSSNSNLPPLLSASSIGPQSLPGISTLNLATSSQSAPQQPPAAPQPAPAKVSAPAPAADPLALGALALMRARTVASEAIAAAQSQPAQSAGPDPNLRNALLRVLAANKGVLGHL